jgi:hypothetical protein
MSQFAMAGRIGQEEPWSGLQRGIMGGAMCGGGWEDVGRKGSFDRERGL